MKGKEKNSEDEIFNPLQSDNKAMGFPANNKRWHLKQQPKGIRYIGYIIVMFFIIILLSTVISKLM